jgi:hypothetical protein
MEILADPLARGAGAIIFEVIVPPLAIFVPPVALLPIAVFVPRVAVIMLTIAARRLHHATSLCLPSSSSNRLSPCCPWPPCWKKHVPNLFWGNRTENMARHVVLSRQNCEQFFEALHLSNFFHFLTKKKWEAKLIHGLY